MFAMWQNLRRTKSKAGKNCNLLRIAHLQLPNGPDRQQEYEHVGQDIGHDERFQDGDLVHAFSDAFQRPLLLHRIAEEDEDEGEDDSPDHHDGHAGADPVLDVQREHTHVEEKLAELERG